MFCIILILHFIVKYCFIALLGVFRIEVFRNPLYKTKDNSDVQFTTRHQETLCRSVPV